MAKTIWNNIKSYCPTPCNFDIIFGDWIEYIWKINYIIINFPNPICKVCHFFYYLKLKIRLFFKINNVIMYILLHQLL